MNAVELLSFPNTVSVKAVTDSTEHCSKRFIRLFHDSLGLTPKLFSRIQRFQSVLDRIVGNEQVEWVNVALHSGYYDQSHLIGDFHPFAGVTPLEYQPVEDDKKGYLNSPNLEPCVSSAFHIPKNDDKAAVTIFPIGHQQCRKLQVPYGSSDSVIRSKTSASLG